MTDLFIDTDVIIDFLIDRQPFSREAAQVFSLIDRKKVKGYTSALCYSNLYYIISKYASRNKVMTSLNELSEMLGNLKGLAS
jgi:predicted nucleic acid-binding protein